MGPTARIAIIGAGVVGCALARELSLDGHEITVFEQHDGIAQETSSRNSGVIHAGLYYPPQSLKAKLCIEGRELLYEWCKQKDVPFKKIGKLVVAQKGEEKELKKLVDNALKSGVSKDNLEMVSSVEFKKKHPYIRGELALWSRESGIVDPHRLCHSLYAAAAHRGVEFHFKSAVLSIKSTINYYIIQTTRGAIESDIIINSAGLYSDDIARLAGIDKYKIYPWRGDYFKVKLPYAVSCLVYPIKKKSDAGLGVHLTLDLQENTYLGPDVEPASSKGDYSARPNKRDRFYESALHLFNDIRPEWLTYETCGIRPKLRSFDETDEKDFIISEDKPGFINLVGIESPGLTASLAIAQHVRRLLSL